MDVRMLLVIHSFNASLACFRLYRFCGACLLIVSAMISTNWSKTESKFLQFNGKLK